MPVVGSQLFVVPCKRFGQGRSCYWADFNLVIGAWYRNYPSQWLGSDVYYTITIVTVGVFLFVLKIK